MMRVTVELMTDPLYVERACAVTKGRTPRARLDVALWRRVLQDEHSPIRNVWLWVEIEDLPSYASTHIVRHYVGVTHFVKSQRGDVARALRPQGTPVKHALQINAQAMIDVSKVRLCGRADTITRAAWTLVHEEVLAHTDRHVRILGEFMKPKCEHTGKCARPCGIAGISMRG